MTEQIVLSRAFTPEITQVDRHTVELVIVPYNEPAWVADEFADGVKGEAQRYREAFAPGVFAGQTMSKEPGTLQRITFVDDHEGGLGKLGHVLQAREEPDRLEAVVRVLRSREGDVEELIADGIASISPSFLPLRGGTRREADGLRVRTRAHLEHVALVPQGAYRSARVLAYRADELTQIAERAAAEADAALADANAWVEAERDRWASLRVDA